MSELPLRVPRPPSRSLAAKLILFVTGCAVVTAVAVTATSVRATRQHVRADLERRLAAVLASAGETLEAALAEGAEPAGLAPLLEPRRPADGRLVLADARGRVLAAAGTAPQRAAPASRPGLRAYRDGAGMRVVGMERRLGAGEFRLVAEVPHERAFAVVSVTLRRLVVVDLCVLVAVGILTTQITRRLVQPIESLSEAARRIGEGHWHHSVPTLSRHDEIGLLAHTFNEMMSQLRRYRREIETANRSLKERNAELQQAKETFEQLSITDGLTKLHNHRFFQDHLTREIKRVSRTGEPLAMLLVDIDDFKGLNDHCGHAAGDELLVKLAAVLDDTVRESDLLARYGGEEFVILAPNTDVQGAYQLAEKVRTGVAESSFVLDDSMHPHRITVSIGLAAFRGDRKEFFQAADRALYRAKAEGKNCVLVDEEAPLS